MSTLQFSAGLAVSKTNEFGSAIVGRCSSLKRMQKTFRPLKGRDLCGHRQVLVDLRYLQGSDRNSGLFSESWLLKHSNY